jgi:two-component system response regulator
MIAQNSILLVEDNPDDEELTLRALKHNPALPEVNVVHDGEQALIYLFGAGTGSEQALPALPQVMLLDLQLPKMGGLEVLRRVRAHPRTKLVPVVILTSSNEEKDILSSYQLGANSYVRKAVEYQLFSETVQQISQYWLQINQSLS